MNAKALKHINNLPLLDVRFVNSVLTENTRKMIKIK